MRNWITATKRSKMCNIQMVTNDLSSRCKLRKVFKKKLSKKSDFRFKNIKKTESPKMISKVLCELLIRSYEQFYVFSLTLNLAIIKNTESSKMASKLPYELLIRSYEQFKYFSQTWKVSISKNAHVNHRKSEHHEK